MWYRLPGWYKALQSEVQAVRSSARKCAVANDTVMACRFTRGPLRRERSDQPVTGTARNRTVSIRSRKPPGRSVSSERSLRRSLSRESISVSALSQVIPSGMVAVKNVTVVAILPECPVCLMASVSCGFLEARFTPPRTCAP